MMASDIDDDRNELGELVTDASEDIEVVQPESEHDPEHDPEPVVDDLPMRKRPLWPLLLLGGALLGFGASFAASYYTRPAAVDVSGLEAEVATLRSQIGAMQAERRAQPDLSSQLAALQTRVERLAAQSQQDAVPAAEPVDLSDLEARLDTLENRGSPEIDEALVTRLETLQAEGLPMELSDIEAMQRQIDSLADRLMRLEDAPRDQSDVKALRAEIEGLQSRMDEKATDMSVSEAPVTTLPIPVDPDSLPRFPADRLRAGAAELAGEGFIRRSLSRHVRVKDEGSAEVLIGEVETAMDAGDVQAAIAAFDQLPDALRNVARGWRAEMEDYVR